MTIVGFVRIRMCFAGRGCYDSGGSVESCEDYDADEKVCEIMDVGVEIYSYRVEGIERCEDRSTSVKGVNVGVAVWMLMWVCR